MISIVMPCYQQAAFLEAAVRSVLDQRGVEVELLVMDPGSEDGSRELLLELHKEYGGRLVLCFAKDQGQSDAVNCGMARARGQVLGWLNSDDVLRPGALAKVAPFLAREEPAWLYGRAGMIDAVGARSMNLVAWYKNWQSRRFSRLKLLSENFVPQQATFWNRSMWDKAGTLDVNRHLDMDYDLWLRFAGVSNPTVLADELADMRIHAAAKGSVQIREQLADAQATARAYAGEYGVRGRMMLLLHRLLSLRTLVYYLVMKPRK
ncbi:MAG: glycosyl transferase [Deltaproteobacteria bacterium RIFOXYD12_FULL_55_16]|nr:MAG: glycosyl transferase [Deltaproteobacteria bacterium RIFOXYD12_FULL_55_16]